MVTCVPQESQHPLTPENTSFGFSLVFAMALVLAVLTLHTGSLNPIVITTAQTAAPWRWFFVQEPVAYLIFFSAILALPYKRNVLMLVASAGVMTLLFFGGWQIPGCSMAALNESLGSFLTLLLQMVVFCSKLVLVMGLILWVRWSLAQLKILQWITLSWKLFLPLLILNLLITAFRFLFSA